MLTIKCLYKLILKHPMAMGKDVKRRVFVSHNDIHIIIIASNS